MMFPPLAVLVLLAVLPLQDPEPRVASLVAQLDDDAAEVRERATAELLKIGKEGVPDMRGALEGSRSAETKARIEQLLQVLHRPQRKEGGATIAGLCAALRVKSADATS